MSTDSSKSHFSTRCDLVLPLSIFTIISFPLWSSSNHIRLLPRLHVTCILSAIFPTLTGVSEGSSYARNGQSSQPSFFSLYVGYYSPFTLCNTSTFPPDQSKCFFFPFFSSTAFQNFPDISYLLSEVP